MNQSTFTSTGGYPLNAERLQELQTTLSLFNAFGHMAGNYTILQGCIVSGLNITNGVVFINGEILEFTGGALGTSIIIIEENVTKPFKNGQSKVVYKKRYAAFGVGTGSILWSNFKRLPALKDLPALIDGKATTVALNAAVTRLDKLEKMTKVFVENGCIMPWGKPANTIPIGWVEWTGAKGKALVGLDVNDPQYSNIESTGGAKSVTLNASNMPRQNITVANTAGTDNGGGALVTGQSNEGGMTIATIGNISPQSIATLSPYRVVNFIHYTG